MTEENYLHKGQEVIEYIGEVIRSGEIDAKLRKYLSEPENSVSIDQLCDPLESFEIFFQLTREGVYTD